MRTILAALCALTLTFGAFAQNTNQKTKPNANDDVVLKGIVVDAMCGKDMATTNDGMAKAAKHKRSCALQDDCAASGYGLMSDGKWIKFDDNGDEQAKDLIKKTDRKSNLTVEVTGKHDGNTFAVSSIKEIPAEKATKPSKTTKKTLKSGS